MHNYTRTNLYIAWHLKRNKTITQKLETYVLFLATKLVFNRRMSMYLVKVLTPTDNPGVSLINDGCIKYLT